MSNIDKVQPNSRARFPLGLILFAGAMTFAITMGVRQNMGLFISPLNTATGLGITNISLAMAFGQLFWGLSQPFAGAIADKFGSARVIVAGALMVAAGTALTPYMQTTLGLIFSIGILAAGGAGVAGPAVIMTATTRLLPVDKRSLAMGIVNAGGSLGQFVIAPLTGMVIAVFNWQVALFALSCIALIALLTAWLLRTPNDILNITVNKNSTTQEPHLPQSIAQALTSALKNRSYVLIAIGFFVCGFHIAFLMTHFPGVVALCGLSPSVSEWSFATIGLFNIAGSLAMGWAVGRWRMKTLLSLVYSVRGLAVLWFLVAPKTPFVMLLFAAIMGITFLSTVPPTAGLVAKLCGTQYMTMLFGLVMVTHQIGGFLGAYLGGKVFTNMGNYDLMWFMDIALALTAALIHLPIVESKYPAYTQ